MSEEPTQYGAPTKAELVAQMERLKAEMHETAAMLIGYGVGHHALEVTGAAVMLQTWIDGVKDE